MQAMESSTGTSGRLTAHAEALKGIDFELGLHAHCGIVVR